METIKLRQNKTFNDILKEVPKPKQLTDDTKLPYIFDLYYDCKTFADIKLYGYLENEKIRQLLREHGYDLKNL